VNVYHVNLQNYSYGTRLYGILCVPKALKKYPAVLEVPGAGVRPYYGNVNQAEKGVITFQIGIHGIPVNLPAEVYANLNIGALRGYETYKLEDKDQYYYKRVYLGCVRAIDFIYSLPEFDGTNLAVCGGSQGGALSIVTAGLDSRVTCLTAFYPALSDVSGYLYGRGGGWPHMFRGADKKDPLTAIRLATAQYYDVVNFAKQLKVPGFYSFGFNDMTCSPTSTYSAYNVIDAPKTLLLVEESAHWTYPEQWEKAWNWMLGQLNN
jgi:cephalosporin-C deacetylase-like acetyl esterase